MKFQKKSQVSKITTWAILCIMIFSSMSLFSFAVATTTVAIPSKDTVSNSNIVETKVINLQPSFTSNKANGMAMAAAAPVTYVAVLSVFSDDTYSPNEICSSLTFDGGTHSFITIKNISSSNINVGCFSGIAPNNTMSLGTWGNKAEHKGIWYNLESYYISKKSAYTGRISIGWALTQTELNTLNAFIKNNDTWSVTSNCSVFAYKAWNSVAISPYKFFGSGYIPAVMTPKILSAQIKNMPNVAYATRASVPWNYVVYYAQGTGTPKASTIYK